MRVRDLAYETVSALTSNRTRSFLTILGVVIGIGAVIAMTAIIGGIKQSLVGELGLSQARLISVSYWGPRTIRSSDVSAMADELKEDLETVMPISSSSITISSATEKKEGSVQGVVPEYFAAMNLAFVAGETFSQDQYDSGALMVILDEGGVRALMGGSVAPADVVGKTVRINGAEYSIHGVLEGSQSTQFGDSYISEVYAPRSTVTQRLTGTDSVDSIYALAKSEDADMEAISKRISDWLCKRLAISDEEKEDYLWIQTMKSIIQQLDTTMASFQLLMTVVASISLVVGGIGIMNMMLTNVTERIREIGLRKALGARATDITRQFLLESVLLTVIGGIFGILLGMGLAYSLSGIAAGALSGTTGTSETTPIVPVLDPQTMLLVAAICVGIGIVFGYYPARRAAKLDPVESLHYQ